DRFRPSVLPDRIPTPEIGRAIIAKRFTAKFNEQRFPAPYDTWPIKPEAFDTAPNLTPRALLRRVDTHITGCLEQDAVVELAGLEESASRPPQKRGGATTSESNLEALDQRFDALVRNADVRGALEPTTEDVQVPELLAAGLSAWIEEQAPTGITYKHD